MIRRTYLFVLGDRLDRFGYIEWRNFHNVVIKRTMKAREENGRAIPDHFVRSYKMVALGRGSQRKTEDVLGHPGCNKKTPIWVLRLV